MVKSKKHSKFFLMCCSCLLFVGLLLGVCMGAAGISMSQIWESIFNYRDTLELTLIRDVRIPRVLSVLFTGGILGVTGAMIQGVTRNPIAEPSLLGVSQGATLVIALFYAAGVSIHTGTVMLAALIGALCSGGIIIAFLLRKTNRSAMAKILLAGTAMSTFFLSLTTVLGLLTNQSQILAFWVAGGFRGATWSDFLLVAAIGVTGLIFAILYSKKINILSLGDDVAIGLGERPERTRFVVLLVMIPMCAAAVAVGKNIGFVGLIVPHIVKKMVGGDYLRIIPVSFLLGAVLLTYADLAARLVYAPYEVPIGLFTALIGVPFFLAVARKEKG